MRNPDYSSTNPENGNVEYKGYLEAMKSDHSGMPPKSSAYLEGDERGHVNASSLNGINTTDNVVPQHRDLNHGAYYELEQGERNALKNGATIYSEKTAVVDGKPGDRPHTFVVKDTITYPDGNTVTLHHSFLNESSAEQEAWDKISMDMLDDDYPNPGDGLRESMSSEEYARLMESTEAELPTIAEEYTDPGFSTSFESELTSDSVETDTDADADLD